MEQTKQNIPKFIRLEKLIIATENIEAIALNEFDEIILKLKLNDNILTQGLNETVAIDYDNRNMAEAEFERIVKELCPGKDWRETDDKE